MDESDSSDGEEQQKVEHYTGPIENAWLMKIPQFTASDNKNSNIHPTIMNFYLVLLTGIIFYSL